MDSKLQVVLAIGGLDPSGGAGLPADARAIAAFGAHCCGIATAVIAQNTAGVARVEPVAADMLEAQLANLLDDIVPDAIKIGMVAGAGQIEVIVAALQRLPGVPVIVDTVLAPSSGQRFADTDAVAALKSILLPLAELITPNIPEAAELGVRGIGTVGEMKVAAEYLATHLGVPSVLLKGGHLPEGAAGEASEGVTYDSVDVLYTGSQVYELRGVRAGGGEVRGTGCLLASAIAAQRAGGRELLPSVRSAKAWLGDAMTRAQAVGAGRRIIVSG